MVEEQNLTSPRNVPLVPPTGKAEHCSRWQKNYFFDWAGSLVIGVRRDNKLIAIGSLSGLTEEVLANWKNYIGKVAEITGMQVFDTGGIRHPKFLRWREDLSARDTDWYRIFGEK